VRECKSLNRSCMQVVICAFVIQLCEEQHEVCALTCQLVAHQPADVAEHQMCMEVC
jgi:hypothetical protein